MAKQKIINKVFDKLDILNDRLKKSQNEIELIMQLLTSTAVLLSETKKDAINKYLCFVNCISLLKDY